MSNIYADLKAQKINWDRKVKYVMNDELSPAGQTLVEALWSLPNASTHDGWLSILSDVDRSEDSLQDYVRVKTNGGWVQANP